MDFNTFFVRFGLNSSNFTNKQKINKMQINFVYKQENLIPAIEFILEGL